MGKFGNIASGVVKGGGDSIDDALASSIKNAGKHLDDLAKNAPDGIPDLKKLDPKLFTKADGAFDENAMKGLNMVLKKMGVPFKDRFALTAKMTKMVGDLPDKSIVKSTGNTVGEVGEAAAKAKSFFKRNQDTLVKVGIGAAAITMVMLVTGQQDPATAIGMTMKGDTLVPSTSGDGEGDGDGTGGADGGTGKGKGKGKGTEFENFIKKWGWYIFGFVMIILSLVIGIMFL
jgi:hypothetical protein